MLIVLACTLGAVMGITLGLFGAGGSILAVPIFVYSLGIEAKAAIAMSLLVVGVTAAIGAWSHARGGGVRLGVALIFAPIAMCGTYLGARMSQYMSGETQLLLFAGVMLLAAYFMGPGARLEPATGAEKLVEADPRAGFTTLAILVLGLEGLAVGVLTGLVGVGGGFLIVPALVLLAGIEMHEAVGTSLLIIALKSAAGFAGYLDQVSVDWMVLLLFTIASAVGILVGARLSRRLQGATLRTGFSGLLVMMALLILYMEGVR
jgi:hypothetical protein